MVQQAALDFMASIVEALGGQKKWVCFGAGETFCNFIQRYCIQAPFLPLPEYVCDNDRNLWGREICGVPVCSPQRLLDETPEKTIIVVSTVLPLAVMDDLIFRLGRYYFMILPVRQLEAYFYYRTNREKITAIYDMLWDDCSKNRYAACWELAVSGNINCTRIYSPSAYWGNDIVPQLRSGWDILYAGAYDGAHIDRALQNCPAVTIHGFEPNRSMYEKLLEKYAGQRQVKLYPYTLGTQEELLSLNIKTALGARVVRGAVQAGPDIETVACRKIDEEIQHNLDYIALDIEGSELEALAGASETIYRCRPHLGICVYHRISDYVDIPLYIHQLNPDYHLFFRHHSCVPFDSVLYAVDPARK